MAVGWAPRLLLPCLPRMSGPERTSGPLLTAVITCPAPMSSTGWCIWPLGPPPPLVAINAGGPGVTAGQTTFVADRDFAGGTTINHANTINLSKVTNPAPMAVYQTARIGNFTYTIAGFVPGSSQTVRLHFAETFFGMPGARKRFRQRDRKSTRLNS